MRFYHSIGILIIFAAIANGENVIEATNSRSSPTALQQEIIDKAPEGWSVAFSADELVLTLSRARFLNSINLPLLSDEELWRERAWTGDYILRIWTTPALDKQEYQLLVEARKGLRDSRVTEERPYYGPYRNETDYFIEKTLPLPLCQIGTQSVWITANDRLGHHWVRPASAQALKKEIIDLLSSKAQQYEKEAQQADTGQPATRPESDIEGSDKPQPEAEGRSR